MHRTSVRALPSLGRRLWWRRWRRWDLILIACMKFRCWKPPLLFFIQSVQSRIRMGVCPVYYSFSLLLLLLRWTDIQSCTVVSPSVPLLSLPLVSRLLKRNGSITSPNGNQGNEAAAHHHPANPLSVDSVSFIFSVNRNPRSVRDGRWLGPSFPSLTISSSFPCLSAHRQRRTVCCLHRVHPSPIHRRRRRRRHHHSHRMRNRLCIFGRKIPLSAEYSAVSTCVARSLG